MVDLGRCLASQSRGSDNYKNFDPYLLSKDCRWRNHGRFPLSQLQELTLERNFHSSAKLLGMLRQCWSLVSLTLVVKSKMEADKDSDGDMEWAPGSVVLDNLVTLIINLNLRIPSVLIETMCCLTLPRIRNLRIHGPCQVWNQFDGNQKLSAMFSEWSSPSVCHLELYLPRSAPGLGYIPESMWFPTFLILREFEELEELILTNEVFFTGG